jgi:hypothetical protein
MCGRRTCNLQLAGWLARSLIQTMFKIAPPLMCKDQAPSPSSNQSMSRLG